MSAAALIALTATGPRGCQAFRANASGLLGRSLSHLVSSAGSKDAKPAVDTSRTGVKRGLFSKIFGGASEGIDYSTLKGKWWWCWGMERLIDRSTPGII
jgi:hypothetical protein